MWTLTIQLSYYIDTTYKRHCNMFSFDWWIQPRKWSFWITVSSVNDVKWWFYSGALHFYMEFKGWKLRNSQLTSNVNLMWQLQPMKQELGMLAVSTKMDAPYSLIYCGLMCHYSFIKTYPNIVAMWLDRPRVIGILIQFWKYAYGMVFLNLNFLLPQSRCAATIICWRNK